MFGIACEVGSVDIETRIPDNLLLVLCTCGKDLFPNIYYLIVIACTPPIYSSEAEKSFSLLIRITII